MTGFFSRKRIKMKKQNKDQGDLRNSIMAVVNKKGKNLEEVIRTLTEVRSFFIDRIQIERIAKEAGLRPADFVSNEHLELFYNLKKGRQDIGYVSKGWSEPGYRIGNILRVPEIRRAALQGAIMKIMKLCAVRGFAITVDEKEGYTQLSIDTVIYTEGLNSVVFSKICENLCECVEKIHDLLH
jgi:hypothetical protein